MENIKTSETLDENVLVPRLPRAQNPSDKTLEESTGLFVSSEKFSESVVHLEILFGQNGGGFDTRSKGIGFGNVEFAEGCIDVDKGIDGVKGGAEEGEMQGVKNADASVQKAGTEVNRNGELVVEKTVMEEGTEEGLESQLNEVDSARKVEVSENGISLFVEVFGPPNGFIQRNETVLGDQVLGEKCSEHVYGGNGTLFSDDGETASVKVSQIQDSMIGVTQIGTTEDEAKGQNGAQEATHNQGCKFSVGNLVWVKTKTQSWWPGIIFDPSHAPRDAANFDEKFSLLVRYFGTGNYVWCSNSQLKPFIENFEQMSAQSNSRSFLGAVDRAVHEFGKHVKLKMTCSCILKKNETKLSALPAANGGSKVEILVPKDEIRAEMFLNQFDPTNFLALVKCLALGVSLPGMLEFAVAQNCLSAFYRAIGHCQLPVHQLRGTNDVKDREEGLNHVEDLDEPSRLDGNTMLPNKGIGSRSRNKDLEVINDGGGVADINISKLISTAEEAKLSISLTTRENKVHISAKDEGSEGKFEKGYESRERKRSKYLSPPYVTWGPKDLPASEENETKDGKEVSRVDLNTGRSVGSSPTGKSSGKKLEKKGSRRALLGPKFSGAHGEINASSLDILSELHFAALDCYYPDNSRYFDSVAGFLSEFRRSVFHDESNHEMDCNRTLEESTRKNLLQTLPGSKVPINKGNGVVEETTEPAETQPLAGSPDMNKNAGHPGSAGEDTQQRSHLFPDVSSKRRRRKKKEIATMGVKTKSTPNISDVSGNPTNGLFIINFQEKCYLAPDGVSLPRKIEKTGIASELLQHEGTVGLPDLNGNCTAPSSLVEGSQATVLTTTQDKPEVKKRKRREGTTSSCSRTKTIAGLPDANGNNTKFNSILEEVPVMGSCSSQDMADLYREGTQTPGSLYLNSKLTSNQAASNGNNARSSSSVKEDQQTGLLSPGGKREPKKRKRKYKAPVDHSKTQVSSGIPDLNGNAAENLAEMNSTPAKDEPQRKRRRRNKPIPGMPTIISKYNIAQRNAEVPGTALLLKFAQGFPVPSKEALVATFCGFGPLKESETQALSEPGSAQVVFENASDAGDALQSLEKCSPFGPALVGYHLRHLSAVSRDPERGTNLQISATSQTMEAFKIPAKSHVMKPHPGEAPDLACMRKNLEMMTSMLEKAGDNLSPETRAKLESEIKGLLKKVSTIGGSS